MQLKFEEMRAGDLPVYLRADVVRTVCHHAACFVRPVGNREPMLQCGSGTFVKQNSQFGILTAAHVIRALRKLDRWFLVLPTQRTTCFEHDNVDYLCSPEPAEAAKGPDIGFIRLSTHKATFLASIVSFVDLAYQKQKIEKELIPRDHGVWVQVGFPEILGSTHRNEQKNIARTDVYCLAAMGGINTIHEDDEFDYYDGEVSYDRGFDVPETFKGMSGGGLWQIRLKIADQKIQILDRVFSGVVFYETASDGIVRAIRSHGRRSVYDYAVKKLILL